MTHGRWFGIAGIAALSVAGSLALVARADHHESAARPTVALAGEVIDLQCFLLHAAGPAAAEHATCAKACLTKGLPAGLLAGGQVYLLLGQGHASVKALAVAHLGGTVVVEGVVVERHGMKAIEVAVMKRPGGGAPAKPAAKSTWMCPMGCVKSDTPGKCPACGMDMEKSKG